MHPSNALSATAETGRRPKRARTWAWALVLGLAAGLSACGGGSQTAIFIPDRVLAFGDESNVLDSTGRKYTVNALTASGAVDCAANPLWTQVVATGRYGLVFPECNPNGVANPTSRIRAQPLARAADLVAQVDAQLAAGGFTGRDLALVMVGAHDIADALTLYPATDVGTLVAQVSEAGRVLGRQVNRMADGGARVIVATAIDLQASPLAATLPGVNGVVGCPRVQGESEALPLTVCLVDRFNAAMRTTIYNDGRRIGLARGDEVVRNALRFPSLYGFTNVTDAVCATTAPPPTCTSATLAAPGATATNRLWSQGLQLSPGGHGQIGVEAANRAATNPF